MRHGHPLLAEFQAQCQSYYALYALSVGGLASQRKHFKNTKPDNRVFFGDKDPTKHPATATLLVSDLNQYTERDGVYADVLAKALLVTIYTEWDERYRVEFANDLGIENRQVVFPLMGDLRKLRHRIIHAKSVLRESDTKFEVLGWELVPGKLLITEVMFAELIKQLNEFKVYVSPNPPAT